MSKVYGDKKLGYGKIKTFEKPADMGKAILSGDADFADAVRQGDSTVDDSSPDAGDFFAPTTDEVPTEKVPIESQIKPDTGTNSKPKPGDKAPAKATLPPVIKPLDEKDKKLLKKEKAKNDYE